MMHDIPRDYAGPHFAPVRPTTIERILYRNRVARIQRMVAYSCIGLALATVAYMGGELSRIVL
jgi:hypothetical protein